MTATQAFHHRPPATAGCDCPIHARREREPFTAPLGHRFAADVSVEPIDRAVAARIYAAHHSYMADLPQINLCHHGLYYQDELVGAITYRYPLLGKKAVRYDADGQLIAEPTDVDALPAAVRSTARRLVGDVEAVDVVNQEVFDGDAFVEVARICLGVRMPNLASATLARSMERFVRDHGHRDVRFSSPMSARTIRRQ